MKKIVGFASILGVLFVIIAAAIILKVADKGTSAVPANNSVIVNPVVDSASNNAGLANPASTNCLKVGGTLKIEKRGDGGEYGLCFFQDNYACEEWALFRGDCPVGGLRTTGFDTDAEKYCAWIGGQTLAVNNAVCKFKDGSSCSDTDLFAGLCQKGDHPAAK
jgi:putative hemolysin